MGKKTAFDHKLAAGAHSWYATAHRQPVSDHNWSEFDHKNSAGTHRAKKTAKHESETPIGPSIV
ncbi:hypothetical protein NCCP2331_31180 [Sporosarcina sp. NCCP-2331]|nr:hypothetical protein NCCP2331_31180 [Sporosarcina sp. NCCP-2331]GLB57278.1 hypothetical protein NCCP2378_30660 [Sporosarcina sp. NCCP-2378]